MNSNPSQVTHSEKPAFSWNGWAVAAVHLLAALGGAALVLCTLILRLNPATAAVGALVLLGCGIALGGYIINPPNQAIAVTLAGSYVGSLRTSGFHWTNPLTKRVRISLRSRNLNGDKLKVNDLRGNPIEIAAVVVWRVVDSAQALFDVYDFLAYVTTQSESAVRHLASSYAYDNGDGAEKTLRGGGDAIIAALLAELQERLAKAGVVVEEARITHLAYAPEIAQAMLRRQQAEAVLAARQTIVRGAVSMVEMALNDLSERHVVELDEERKAAMVSNLLVVLCGESDVQPVVNTGTLYT